ncbi:MAG TPA: insulinase family protein [Candidatus Atribacteria bacterium]|nr:insulinase family protein [Candidatus Atribacteria bacterium]
MDYQTGKVYHGFRLDEIKEIRELKATARLFEHVKSGARLFYLSCDDDNKVFYIGFRTPPSDNTGLPHIMEHSVLCGSRKFPTKEPFIDLAKGSLNTFLNAMTYPDKTVYPVASRNDKDFVNLMDVYLDAVFYPNIHSEPTILMQEGWHYDLEDKSQPLAYKGVVYNEMKGAFSSPEQVLFRKIQESLYPDTPYSFESGGDPDYIPDLTQEQFTAYHKKYYHPSNSYIYLYGDGDIDAHLEFLDNYLKDYDRIDIDSAIPEQKPFDALREIEVEYPVSSEEGTDNKTYLSLNFSVGCSTDPFLYLAMDILEYILLEHPAAPLKKALLDANIGKDVFGLYASSLRQPFFSIVAKDANLEDKEAFIKVINETLTGLVQKGIDKRMVEAGINNREFRLREADYGRRPKGLIYGLKCLESWLYDEDPTMHLYYEDTLAEVKRALNEPLFEELIEKYLLDNAHSTMVVVKPRPGLAEERDKEIFEKLQAYKAQLSDEELDDIVRCTLELKKRQTEPDPPEAQAKIPMVELSDIDKKAEVLPLTEKDESGIKVLFHPIETNGIAYLNLWFDTRTIPADLLPYSALLVNVLGEIGTENYTYEELSNEINIHTGGIHYSNEALAYNDMDGAFTGKFVVKSKALVEKLPDLVRLLSEIITGSSFKDAKRLKEIIQQARSRMEMNISYSGHVAAMNRLASYFSAAGKYNEITSGVTFYHFLSGIEKSFDAKKDEIAASLEKASSYIFTKDNLTAGITISEKDYPAFQGQFARLAGALSDSKAEPVTFEVVDKAANEGLMTPGKVQYVAKGYSYKRLGYSYSGALQVLSTIARLDYLWNRVRIQGGAYGIFAQFTRSGMAIFSSYRDPNLKQTLDNYDGFAKYLADFNANETEMTRYIIGTISRLDEPLTPQMKGERSEINYFTGTTQEDIQRERDEVLSVKSADIKALSQMIDDVMKRDYYCVVGSEGRLKAEKDLFGELVNVFG